MKRIFTLSLMVLCTAAFVGCPSNTEQPEGDGAEPADGHGHEHAEGEEPHGHSHGDEDALTWSKEDLVHEGYEINLGLHGPHLHAGEAAEVAVEIKKDEEPVEDAKVYVTLLDESAENVLVEEQSTILEPTTAEEDAHYAQAELAIPEDARRVTIRYRIEFTDAEEFSSDVLFGVE